jgi:hypothetical protein
MEMEMTDEIPKVHFWRGRPITELSRDELIEVIDYLAHLHAEKTTPSAIQAMALGRVEMLRRGERF